MSNPFSYIKFSICPARGDGFIGRQRQLARIREMIAAPKPYHISVFGLPHIGKTSFLLKLREILCRDKDYLCPKVVSFVEGDFGNNMVAIIDALADEDFSLLPIADAVSNDMEAEHLVDSLRKELLQIKKSGKRTILLLDEFERILVAKEKPLATVTKKVSGWSQEEYELFLELLMERDLNVVCVTASRPQMSNILYRYRPTFNPFVPFLLGGFDDTEMKEYFDIMEKESISIDGVLLGQEQEKAQKQELLRVCGRNPYLLTLMGNELFENNQKTGREARKSIRGLFSYCRNSFQEYFDEILLFMVVEEQKKMRSFSHIIKCYFGQFDDYQDIKERCIAKGYLQLAAKNSPYTYQGKVFEFQDYDDKFPVLRPDGRVMSDMEKRQAGLTYITVSSLFIDYLFAAWQPIGKKGIIPLDLVDDPRDLLTGLVHALRDITKREMQRVCKSENLDPNKWDEYLASQYRSIKPDIQQIIYANPNAQQNDEKYAIWEKNSAGNIQCLQSQVPHSSQPSAQNWQSLWDARPIRIAAASMQFVSERLRDQDNEMASLDPISLMDQAEIFRFYWQYHNQPMFSNYFSILPNGCNQLFDMLQVLKQYRNKVSHFSRHGYGENEIRYCRIYCRQLLKGIYHYLYNGTKCPAGEMSDTPGV